MRLFRLGLSAVAVAAAVACGDSTGVTVSDITGTWSASSAVFTNLANSSEQFDLIADGGGTITATFSADGSYSISITVPPDPAELDVGTVDVRGDTLTLAESGQGSPTDFIASVSGNTLTLTTDEEEYDFDDNGTDDPARLRVVFQKQ